MKMTGILSLSIVGLFLIVPFAIRSQTVSDMMREKSAIQGDIEQLDRMIAENRDTLRLLKDQGARLKAISENPQLYRLPVLIEGKALYVTLNDSDLDDFSNSLALDDLLAKHKVTKGRFRSSDPQEWKKILVREGTLSKIHLRDIEIPAIEKRTGEIDQEIALLTAKRDKLNDKLRASPRPVTK